MTLGLYELLFKCKPKLGYYKDADLDAYKNICIKTNVHKRNYDPHRLVNCNPNSDKYKKIIQYMFPAKTITGKG